MPKSSIDYAELQGLKIALGNINPNEIIVIEWLKGRIRLLEEK